MEEQTMDGTQVAVNEVPTESAAVAMDVVEDSVVFAITKNINKPDAEPGFGVYKEGYALYKRTNPSETGSTEHIDTEIVAKVSVSYPVAHSAKGLSQIVDDEEELVNLANAGFYDKLVAALRAKYTQRDKDGNFINVESGEASVDAEESKEIIATPFKRRALSDTQKAVKVLKGMSQADLAAALRQMGITI